MGLMTRGEVLLRSLDGAPTCVGGGVEIMPPHGGDVLESCCCLEAALLADGPGHKNSLTDVGLAASMHA